MKHLKNTIWYGIFIWVIPFIVALIIYPLRLINHPFFQSIMSVVLVVVTFIASISYFSKIKNITFSESIFIGFLWLIVSMVLNIGIFVFGPIRMTLVEYLVEIGVAYLMIPVVFVGFSYKFLKRKGVKVCIG